TELDANGDGVITVEEFRPFVLDPQRFGPTIREFAQALAALGDPDGDGFIERPLFVALMRAIGFEEENIHALFDAFGPDAEDRITVAVWAAGIEDFYAPDLAGIPGDRLVVARAVWTGPSPEAVESGCAHTTRGRPGRPGAAPHGTARRPTRLQPSRPRARSGRVL